MKLQQGDQFVTDSIEAGVGQAEIHFLVAPGAAGNPVLFEGIMNRAVPFDRIFRRGVFNNTVFAAIQRGIIQCGGFDRGGKTLVKENKKGYICYAKQKKNGTIVATCKKVKQEKK